MSEGLSESRVQDKWSSSHRSDYSVGLQSAIRWMGKLHPDHLFMSYNLWGKLFGKEEKITHKCGQMKRCSSVIFPLWSIKRAAVSVSSCWLLNLWENYVITASTARFQGPFFSLWLCPRICMFGLFASALWNAIPKRRNILFPKNTSAWFRPERYEKQAPEWTLLQTPHHLLPFKRKAISGMRAAAAGK